LLHQTTTPAVAKEAALHEGAAVLQVLLLRQAAAIAAAPAALAGVPHPPQRRSAQQLLSAANITPMCPANIEYPGIEVSFAHPVQGILGAEPAAFRLFYTTIQGTSSACRESTILSYCHKKHGP
jgi:hypothetical protein